MKTRNFIFLCILLPNLGLAQSTINGEIVDEKGKPLPFVTVGLMAAGDSSLLRATASDLEGMYVFESISAGTYLLKASAVGHRTKYSAYFALGTSSKQVPRITLAEVANELGEVLVTAKKPFVEQRIDRMVVNVEGSIIGSGSTALEVLQKAPGVTVDHQNNRVQLRGKEGVIVQIDGKQSYLSQEDVVALLRTMSSDNIATIEIITSPGARYDAAGNAGIIDIRLKKNASLGTNGSLSIAGGTGRFHRERASGQLNNRTAKLNLFGSYSMNRGGNYWDFWVNSVQQDPSESEPARQTFSKSNSYLKFKELGQNAKAGLDFTPSKNTILGLVWTGLWSDHREKGPAQSTFSRKEGGPAYLQAYTQKTQNSISQNHLFNFNAQHTFGEKGQLSADLDYGQFDRDYTNDLLTDNLIAPAASNVGTMALFNSQPTTIKIRTAKADYSQGLPNGWELESGIKWADITTDNNLTVRDGAVENLRKNPELSNHFVYDERVGAIYATLSGGIGKVDSLKTRVQVGLRAEHTRSEGNSITLNQVVPRKYLNLFPSVFVSRPLSRDRMVSLSYSYRIDRPNYQSLNPARGYVDAFTFQEGNAFLKPQYTSAFEMRYGFRDGKFLTLGASLTTDLMSWVFYGIGGNNRYAVMENAGNMQSYSLTAGLPVTISKRWQFQATLMSYLNQYQFEYENEAVQINNLSARLNGNNSFILGKGWTAELSGWVTTPAMILLNRSPWMGSLDVGVQKAMTKSIKVKFSIQDVFHTNGWITSMNVPGKLVSNMWMKFDTRIAMLNLTYTFGNQKVKATRERSTGSESESRRAN
ncbi:outer membrane beta-barrel protein [Persicitalea sp.]|uniref:outer membrane beta-barrel protein n=1 Tax=Persicitalea sp. TaxID=3100273 RepID=UPI003594358E